MSPIMFTIIYQLIRQNRTSQKSERVPESNMVMKDRKSAEEYDNATQDRLTSAHSLVLSKLSKVIPEKGAVLEVGCGPGTLLTKMAGMFPESSFIGVDLSETMLSIASKAIANKKLNNIEVKKWDMYEVGELEQTYDVVVISLTLHHCESEAGARKLINQCTKILKPNGVLLIFDMIRPKTDGLAIWIADTFGKGGGDYLHQDCLASLRAGFTFLELNKILQKSNLKNYEHIVQTFGVYQFVFTKTKTPGKQKYRLPKLTLKNKIVYLLHKVSLRGKI